MDKEEIYQSMIQTLGQKVSTLEIEKAELNALLVQAQKHLNALKKGGENKNEAPVAE